MTLKNFEVSHATTNSFPGYLLSPEFRVQFSDVFLFELGPITFLDSGAEVVMPTITALLRRTVGVDLRRNVSPIGLEICQV